MYKICKDIIYMQHISQYCSALFRIPYQHPGHVYTGFRQGIMKRVVTQLAVHYFGTAAERPDQCSIHPVLQFFFSTLFVCFYHVIMLQLSGYIFLYRGISKTLRIRRYLQISSINICLVFTYCTYIHMSYTIYKVPQSLITLSIK